MYCSSCGVALSQHLTYCNRCGAQLAAPREAIVKKDEKRHDEYLDGLFWITVFGLGLIVGGIALLQKLQVGWGLTVAYLVLSSAAFLVNFWLSLREVFRINRSSAEPQGRDRLKQLDTNELGPMNEQTFLHAAPSVTENTTRELESIRRENLRL